MKFMDFLLATLAMVGILSPLGSDTDNNLPGQTQDIDLFSMDDLKPGLSDGPLSIDGAAINIAGETTMERLVEVQQERPASAFGHT